jgi:ELWxxDGT repeat protein
VTHLGRLAVIPAAVAFSVLIVLTCGNAHAQRARLVSDINPSLTGASSFPGSFSFVQNVLYFSADDGVNGSELWRTDGTAEGTWIVRDIQPGRQPSNPGPQLALSGRIVFTASDPRGRHLWVSDGTAAGTVLLEAFSQVSLFTATVVGTTRVLPCRRGNDWARTLEDGWHRERDGSGQRHLARRELIEHPRDGESERSAAVHGE